MLADARNMKNPVAKIMMLIFEIIRNYFSEI